MGESDDLLLRRRRQEEILAQQQEQATVEAQGVLQQTHGSVVTLEQERMIEAEVTENQTLLDQAAIQMEPIEAQTTAQGSPVQQQAPARMSRKQKKAAERQAKQDRINHAREKIGESADYLQVDEHTAVIADNLAMRKRSIKATFSTDQYRNTFDKADARLSYGMLQGHIMNEQGEPLNEEEAQKKAADIQLMEDYKSENIHRRRPIMMQYFKRLIDMKIDKEMLNNMDDSAFLAENIVQLDHMGQDITLFENTMRDPLNKTIYEELPEEMRNFIKHKGDMGATMMTILNINLKKRGLTNNAAPTSDNSNSDFIYENIPLEDTRNTIDTEIVNKQMLESMLIAQLETLPQMEKEAYETYHQHREDQKVADAARVKALAQAQADKGGGDNVTMDHISAQIYDNLTQLHAERTAVDKEIGIKNLSRESGVDDRVLGLMFGQRYNIVDLEKTDKQGEYARAVQAANIQRIRDYASNDLEKRRSSIDMVVEEFLNFHFSVEMFTQGRLGHNAAIYAEMADKMTYFENILKDPINKPYFDNLPSKTVNFLKQKHTIMTGVFANRLTSATNTKGISCNTATFTSAKMPKDMVDMTNEMARTAFAEAVEKLKTAERDFKG
ncbi:hypothetical protein RFF05_09785 [Bengtsoniella intestinalis]|uniref:hypothetical protein n=1 Tax=Bengtsoniella intestinalis TaxID=3073143 RepID=UPI00391EFF53